MGLRRALVLRRVLDRGGEELRLTSKGAQPTGSGWAGSVDKPRRLILAQPAKSAHSSPANRLIHRRGMCGPKNSGLQAEFVSANHTSEALFKSECLHLPNF